MGLHADAINKTQQLLVAAQAGGQPLEYVQKVFFGNLEINVQLAKPFLVVRLPQFPYTEEDWVASGALRQAKPAVEIIGCIDEHDPAFPYGKSGDATKRGILTLMEDVMNVIEAGRDTLLGANAKLLDLNMGIAGHQKTDGTRTWQAVVRVEYKARFIAGGR